MVKADIYEYMQQEFDKYDMQVFFMLSPNYYESPACLNEMGAAWVLKKDYTSILLPGFSFKEIEGAVNPRVIGVDLCGDDRKARLGEIKRNLCKDFSLKEEDIVDVDWEEERDGFLTSLDEAATSKTSDCAIIKAAALNGTSSSPAPAQSKATSSAIVVGDIIEFGTFGGNPLNWRVLDVQEGRALLLTNDIIEKRLFHNKPDATWGECELHDYLNSDFLNSFGTEKSRIVQRINTTPQNKWFGAPGGDSTDKVFLLSIEEVVDYFGDSGQLENRPEGSWRIDDKHNSKRVAKYKGKAWWWWLRSPGYDSHSAAYVYSDGALYVYGHNVIRKEGGVRPALWLNLKS
jgi:hypothetical protein